MVDRKGDIEADGDHGFDQRPSASQSQAPAPQATQVPVDNADDDIPF